MQTRSKQIRVGAGVIEAATVEGVAENRTQANMIAVLTQEQLEGRGWAFHPETGEITSRPERFDTPAAVPIKASAPAPKESPAAPAEAARKSA